MGNIHRCHLQVEIWKAALEKSPPEMNPTNYGWELDHQGILHPRTVQPGTLSAPTEILQLIRCSWKTSVCRIAACNCSKIGCTVFCQCGGGKDCKSPITQHQSEEDSEKATEEPDVDDED